MTNDEIMTEMRAGRDAAAQRGDHAEALIINDRIKSLKGATGRETWGAVFNRHLARGHDHGSAAFAADQWEKRQRPERWKKDCPSTHCERSGECRSPNECCAKGERL